MSEYIGMRIIPRHDGVWDINKNYEPLVIVLDKQGDSYMSRRAVPEGVQLSDDHYWAFCQSFSAQLDAGQKHLDQTVVEMKKANADTLAETKKMAEENITAINKTCGDTVAAVNKTAADTVTSVNQKTDAVVEDTRQVQRNVTDRMARIEARQEANVTASTMPNADYAAEVVDARVGEADEQYPSLGAAVRTQASAFHDHNAANFLHSLQWYRYLDAIHSTEKYEVTNGTRFDEAGEQVPYIDGKYSVLLIPVSYGDRYVGKGPSLTIFALDAEKKMLSTFTERYHVQDPRVKYIGISVLTDASAGVQCALTNMEGFDLDVHPWAKKEVCYATINGEDVDLYGVVDTIFSDDRAMDNLPIRYFKRFDQSKYELVPGLYNAAGELVPVTVRNVNYGCVLIPCTPGKHYYFSEKTRSAYFFTADRKLVRSLKDAHGTAGLDCAYFSALVTLDSEEKRQHFVSNIPDFNALAYEGYEAEKYFIELEEGKELKHSASALTSDDDVLPDGTDLDDVTENRFCLLNETFTYPNRPVEQIGYLVAQHVGRFVQQLYYVYHGPDIYRRIKQHNGVWTAWKKVTAELPATLHSSDADLLADGTDLNDVTGNRFCLLESSRTYANSPMKDAAFLSAYTVNGFVLQTFFAYSGAKMYKRRRDRAGNWESWREVFSGDYVTNQNTFTTNIAQNTYQVTATPTITTDNHNFLASRNDKTDVTAEIAALLATGYCKLGPGDFYVANLTMPDNSVLEGSGNSRLILLDSVADGYAVKLGNYCRIRNLTILGGTANIDVSSETVGTRHGIMFSGQYNSNQGTTVYCHIHDVHISHFSGGGITLFNTGYPASGSMVCSNAIITNCGAGINISYWSEYSHFTNVECHRCHYGCVNNGGNNAFANCCFSENKVGMLFDNYLGDKPNNSHGSVVGCLFNHSDSNNGIGIKLVNIQNGEVFSACQLFYSDIVIEGATNIIFSNFVCGRNVDISITNGQTILFDACVFNPPPNITVKDSNNVRFLNCYDQQGNTVTG